MFDLTGKRALVTGASGGIGAAIAAALHAQGADLALSGSRAEVLAEKVAELGARAHAVPSDLSDAESAAGLLKAAVETLGGVDILVHCAGITRDNLAMRMKDEEWQQVIEVNLSALGADSVHYLGRRRDGKPGPGQLRRFQGRIDRNGQGIGRRSCQPGGDGQLRRARIYRNRDDRRLECRPARAHHRRHPGRPYRRGQRRRRRLCLFGQRGGGLRDRPDIAYQWRHGDVVTHVET